MQVSTVYRHGVRFGKAGLAEVDVYPSRRDHLYGITGTAHGPNAADSFHNLGEIDLRGVVNRKPKSAPRLASWAARAQRISALLGVQPKLTQVPPVNRLSVMATW